MDKKQIVLGIIALWVSIPVWGREITIEECYRKAQANYQVAVRFFPSGYIGCRDTHIE